MRAVAIPMAHGPWPMAPGPWPHGPWPIHNWSSTGFQTLDSSSNDSLSNAFAPRRILASCFFPLLPAPQAEPDTDGYGGSSGSGGPSGSSAS